MFVTAIESATYIRKLNRFICPLTPEMSLVDGKLRALGSIRSAALYCFARASPLQDELVPLPKDADSDNDSN